MSVLLALYDSTSSTSPLRSANIPNVPVSNGLFTATVPNFTAADFSGLSRWLEISVSTNGGAFTTLSPRQQVTWAPYAMVADRARSLDAQAASAFLGTGGGTLTGNLAISDPATIQFGTTTRQMLNLYGTEYGIGIQANTLYQRSAADFAWYKGGQPSGNNGDPGGGKILMSLNDTLGLSLRVPLYAESSAPVSPAIYGKATGISAIGGKFESPYTN